MSYKISYGAARPMKHRNTNGLAYLGVAIVFAGWLLALGFAMPTQAAKFREMFIPWSQQAVQDALADLRSDVREGVAFREAAEAFCVDLLMDGNEG